MATATAVRRSHHYTAPRRPRNARRNDHQPSRVLVTDYFGKKFAALVTIDEHFKDHSPLLHDIDQRKSIESQADEINRDFAHNGGGMRAFVCPIEVYLQRGVSLEAATTRRPTVDAAGRVLVTDSFQPWAAHVIACSHVNCADPLCVPLVHEIGDPEAIAIDVAKANRDPSNIADEICSYVCPIDVWLEC